MELCCEAHSRAIPHFFCDRRKCLRLKGVPDEVHCKCRYGIATKKLYPRQARIRFAKTQMLELYIKNIPIKYRVWPIKMQSFWFFVPTKELGYGAKPCRYLKFKKIIFDKVYLFRYILKMNKL